METPFFYHTLNFTPFNTAAKSHKDSVADVFLARTEAVMAVATATWRRSAAGRFAAIFSDKGPMDIGFQTFWSLSLKKFPGNQILRATDFFCEKEARQMFAGDLFERHAFRLERDRF